jgi:polyhydroxybutyrate depolymerase
MRLTVFAAGMVAALGQAVAGELPPGDHQGSLLWEGRARTWLLHVPPGAPADRAGQARPLVIALHGAGGTGENFAGETRFSTEADLRGFLVAYPDGTGAEPTRLTWNAGFCCGYAIANKIDDVGFLGQLVAAVSRTAIVDPRRIYLAGASNGGMLSYRAAAETTERYAAVATVAAAIGGTTRFGEFYQISAPKRPLPILMVHGRRDPYVLFEGGVSPVLGYPLRRNLAVADAWRFWSEADHCAGEPSRGEPDPGRLVRVSLAHCAADTEITLWEITQGEHNWPGDIVFPREAAGETGNVAGVIFDFFQRHAAP